MDESDSQNKGHDKHFFCSGSKQLPVGAVVSKSKYIAIGISPFDLKLFSKVVKFFLMKLYIMPGTLMQFSMCLLCLFALAKNLPQ